MDDRTDKDPDDKSRMDRVVERARGTGVGTEDPHIIGDAGPTDVPPGKDPDPEWPPGEADPDDDRSR